MKASALHDAILAAHERGDGRRLIALYARAADRAEARGEIDHACFFLTQAWVFALETGSDRARHLHRRLAAQGREVPLRHLPAALGKSS